MKYLSEEQNKCFVGTGELNKAGDSLAVSLINMIRINIRIHVTLWIQLYLLRKVQRLREFFL